jgi:hypothetical protein
VELLTVIDAAMMRSALVRPLIPCEPLTGTLL